MDDFDKETVRKLARNFAKHIPKNLLYDEEEDLKIAAVEQIVNAWHVFAFVEIYSIFNNEFLTYRYINNGRKQY